MPSQFRPRVGLFLAACCAMQPVSVLLAQESHQLPVLVITSDRIALLPETSGSSIQVIRAPEIEAWGSRSIVEVLRGAAGLDITEQGGPGGLTNATLRGSSVGQTLVLIDGIRVGDPGGIAGEYDLSSLPSGHIERIEILRGPQSALYGSDAMGGVINIITRRGSGKPGASLTVEGGSYGTTASTLRSWGSAGKASWSLSLSGMHTDGFSRYGYRIGRIEPFLARPLENDKTNKLGGHARLSYVLTPST
ncbi:MAG: TonB-dependent receptor, partial [Alphaproteobacteria bacterium]|nr:TonB-dependent receptor [Alphaproteobacteria bacterium]